MKKSKKIFKKLKRYHEFKCHMMENPRNVLLRHGRMFSNREAIEWADRKIKKLETKINKL